MTALPITDHAPQRRASTRWRLDPSASSAEFQVPHFWGLVTVKGHFERLDGRLETDESGQLQMSLTIDAASLHAGIRQRDKHLRAAAFFDTQHHPEVRLQLNHREQPTENPFRVEGELEPPVSAYSCNSKPLQQTDDELHIEATTTVDQCKLGMTWNPSE